MTDTTRLAWHRVGTAAQATDTTGAVEFRAVVQPWLGGWELTMTSSGRPLGTDWFRTRAAAKAHAAAVFAIVGAA